MTTSSIHGARAVLILVCCMIVVRAQTVSMSGLKVSGNVILNGNNQQVQIRGVDRSGTEYACIQGWGIFDGPSDQASISAMISWGVNTVRVPLNEDCWLNINGVSASYGGSNYINAITSYVNLITGSPNNMAVILDLHWSAAGTTQATAQTPMPDNDHAPAFWTSVANTFKSNSAVIFDLFNEPYPDSNANSTAAWNCLLNGGTCPGFSYQAVGMQSLVNTVRATGATNILMIAGIQYANNLQVWTSYAPTDPLKQIAASAHIYNFNACAGTSCWNQYILPVALHYPVIFGEIGENDCASSFITGLMTWADQYCINYVAWSWDTANCANAPALITDYSGTASGFGAGYKSYISAKTTNVCSSSITATAAPATSAPATTVKATSAPATTVKATSAPATTTKVTSAPTTTKAATSAPATTSVPTTTPASTTAKPGTVIYTDYALASGWQDYSWAKVNYTNANPHYGSTGTSISFVLNNYQGLYFHAQTSFPATQYSQFQFYVYAPSALPASTLFVRLYNSSEDVFGSQSITTPNALTQSTWVQQSIPLSSFGVGSSSVSGIVIQYNGSGAGGTIYVDSVSLQ